VRIDRLRPNLINKNYTRLWYGQAASSIGDSVFTTTLVLWIVTDLARGKPWAPAAVSTVLLSAGVAVLVIGPLAGVFVDRWDSRLTMLRTDQIRCGIVLALTALSFLPAHDLPFGVWLGIICVVVLALNSAGQFFTPARTTVIRDIVTSDADRARAAGIAQATGQTAMIVGPPLAAPLLFTVGLQWGLLFNALSYVASFLTIRSITLPGDAAFDKPVGKSGFRAEFVAGLRFFGRSRLLMTLLTIAVIGQAGVSALGALDVFFLTRNLHSPLGLYGYMGTALGVGGVVGALLAGRVVKMIGVRTTAWLGLIVGGVLLIIYSRQSVFVAAIALLFLAAIPITTLNTALAPMLMSAAPREYLGRISAVFQPGTQLASMLATLVSGWLVSSALVGFHGSLGAIGFNAIDLVFGAAGVLIVITGIYAQFVLPRPAKEPVTPGPDPVKQPASGTLT
jgi:MFS family permease